MHLREPIVLGMLISIVAAAGADPSTNTVLRTSEGHSNLEGNWTNASLTSLQRAPRYKTLVLAADEIEQATNTHPQVIRQLNDDEQGEATRFDGSDLKRGRGYNAFWIDPGMTFNVVNGEYRTSWIVDPPDGQIPYTDAGRRAMSGTNFDGPEGRPLGERCIVNSGNAGPPMTNYLYNNNYEIVQTREVVLIRAEMNNYARIIRIGGRHIDAAIGLLHGNSIGHWEGSTLVAETTNFHPLHARAMIGLSSQAVVRERFTRVSPQKILYEYTVEDPVNYRQPWRGEMSLDATSDRVFEYACHEGNYAMSGVLGGAREEEKRGRSQPAETSAE
jgi:hypothetical protein